ncbi:MAG: hypothetical protein ACOCNB_09655 [Acetivibrio ethanolgignens]
MISLQEFLEEFWDVLICALVLSFFIGLAIGSIISLSLDMCR